MDKIYFLHSDACNNVKYENYEDGMEKLFSVKVNSSKDDVMYKHESIYNGNNFITLCGNYSQKNKVIIEFLEQCKTEVKNIVCDTELDNQYKNDIAVGFMGIDFTGIKGIDPARQITDEDSKKKADKKCYKNLLLNGFKDKFCYSLARLYPNYIFDDNSIDEIIDWQKDQNTMIRIIDLLDDVRVNPYSNGLGNTEKLKGRPECTKEINGADRLLYEVKGNTINIKSLKGHPDTSKKYKH